jgi:regulatory helix-turn-helix LysR family protein
MLLGSQYLFSMIAGRGTAPFALLRGGRRGTQHHQGGGPNVSQPALSRQIRDLEDELGVVLLERSPKEIRLTPAGKLSSLRHGNYCGTLPRRFARSGPSLRPAR